MTPKLDILIKCITLLHREQELGENTNDNSKDLVKTILNMYKDMKRPLSGGDSVIIEDLKNLISDMVHNPDNYDKHSLLQSLELILKDKDVLLKTIDKSINTEITAPGIKRSIISLRNHLNNYYKETEIINTINKASYHLTTGRIDESIQEFTAKLITSLEALSVSTKVKDPGIVDEIDISDDESFNNLLDKVKEQSNDDGRFKTGWKELNDMLGGGFRAGETVITSALQHNYKSGFVQSLFAQLCMYNKPKLKDPTKKPLNVFISYEDDAEIIANFLYRYLYFAENNTVPDLSAITSKEVSQYIRERLSRTGYHIKILRVNPSEWTYKHLFNKLLEYEANGFEINILVNDYLSKLPTTGCYTAGPMGTDIRDLYNRIRNFTSAKGILFISPHQLSTEAKQLLRNGIAAKDLVKEVANKGYYEGTKQLDQVPDVEIHQHIAYIARKPYLTFQRGKRRFPEIIDEEKKYFMLPFPNKAPIPPNINLDGEYIGFKYSNDKPLDIKSDEEFDF